MSWSQKVVYFSRLTTNLVAEGHIFFGDQIFGRQKFIFSNQKKLVAKFVFLATNILVAVDWDLATKKVCRRKYFFSD